MSSGILGAASSGLQAADQAMAQVAANLANVNTIGYKSGLDLFQQLMEATLSAGTAPAGTQGGQNPIQTPGGSAVGLATTEIDFGEGGLETTGIASNLALSGDGWFVVQTPTGPAYTRDGAFQLDATGQLVDAQGDPVLGWTPATIASGQQNGSTLQPLAIHVGAAATPSASTQAVLQGNLDSSVVGASAAASTAIDVPVTFYDAEGASLQATLVFASPAAASGGGVQWQVSLVPAGSTTPYSGTNGVLTFPLASTAGASTAPTWTTAPSWTITPTDGSPPLTITLTNADVAQMTSDAAGTTATATANGFPAGSLTQYAIGSDGTITGTYSNGQTAVLGQVAVATVPNNGGMLQAGNNLWQPGPNAGPPSVGIAGQGGRGSILSGQLEQSNVSLSDQFTQLISDQEAYAANAKALTTAQANQQALLNAVQ